MTTVTTRAAESRLSKLIARVQAGEEAIITRDDKPVARLAPIDPTRPKRRFGSMQGRVWVGPEVFEPLPEEELRLCDGE